MSKGLVWVKSKSNYYKIISKIKNLNIIVYEIKKDDEYVYLKVSFGDLNRLRKYLPSCKFIIYKEVGFNNYKKLLKKYLYFIVAIIVGLITLYFTSHIIVEVKVVHSSKYIRNLLYDALEEEGIKRLSFKKNYNEIVKIKEKILKKYKDEIEWLEIETNGMKYIIRVEQRIINRPVNKKQRCHIIAKKSGIITDITTHKGEALFTRGDYVSKDDIIVSGNITFNNEVKETVCAEGIVKAEVWYTVNVSLPLKYYKTKETGKKRINYLYDVGLGKSLIFRDRIKNYEYDDNQIFSFLNVKFYKRKETEIIKNYYKYTYNEALNKAITLAKEKINIKKDTDDKVITQKVLKNDVNDSTMNLEMFFAVEEEIGQQKEFEVESEVE